LSSYLDNVYLLGHYISVLSSPPWFYACFRAEKVQFSENRSKDGLMSHKSLRK